MACLQNQGSETNKIVAIIILLSICDTVFIRLSSHHQSCVEFCLGTHQPAAPQSKVCSFIRVPITFPLLVPLSLPESGFSDTENNNKTADASWISGRALFSLLKLRPKIKNCLNRSQKNIEKHSKKKIGIRVYQMFKQ